MKINQFAIYRANRDTAGGRKLWHHTYEYVREKRLRVQIEDYRQQTIADLQDNEAVNKVRIRFQGQIEISDVLVLNRYGEISCFYMDSERVVPLAGFIRLNPSGAVIRSDTVDYHFSDRDGNWMTADDIIIDGKQFYLMEHTEFRKHAPAVILDAYGKMIADQWTQGFNEEAKQKIRDSMKPPEPIFTPPVWDKSKLPPMFNRMERWQKSYENGEYIRSAESGLEANYDMIDGRVNNQAKEKSRTKEEMPEKRGKRKSVIRRLREKQIAIAVRDGKPVPKYLQMEIGQERNRG